jgi:hypothetical protein
MEHECRDLSSGAKSWGYGKKSEHQLAVSVWRLQENQVAGVRDDLGPAVCHPGGERFGKLGIPPIFARSASGALARPGALWSSAAITNSVYCVSNGISCATGSR